MTEVVVHRPLPSRSPVQYTEMRSAESSLTANGLPLNSSPSYFGNNASSSIPLSPTNSSSSTSSTRDHHHPHQPTPTRAVPRAAQRRQPVGPAGLALVQRPPPAAGLGTAMGAVVRLHARPAAVVRAGPVGQRPLSGFYSGSSDRFSGFLTMSSDSLGPFKLDGSREFPSDYESLKGSHDTLESGYRWGVYSAMSWVIYKKETAVNVQM